MDTPVDVESENPVANADANASVATEPVAPSASASVAPAPAPTAKEEAAATTFQPILAYKAAQHDKLGEFKAAMLNPALSVSDKAKLAFNFLFFFGIDREIADFGLDETEVANIHDVAIKYYGKTESVFRFLQFLTSTLATFAHGANDVGLSVGPIAILYGYWSDSKRWQGKAISSTPVLDWQLATAAVALCIGFWFYGPFLTPTPRPFSSPLTPSHAIPHAQATT